MGYSFQQWLDRHRARADITSMVTHLTRETDELSAVSVLAKILNDHKLIASDAGFTVGRAKVVCFQEAPVFGLAQNIQFEERRVAEFKDRVRYRGVGLAFPKRVVYDAGGRPVLYETKDAAKAILPKDQHWRIVPFDLSDRKNIVDWSHEREWRMPTDFDFSIESAVIIVQSADDLRQLRGMVDRETLDSALTITVMNHVLN